MGRDRCLICGNFVLAGEQTTTPAALGVAVHRHCYVRDAGLEPADESPDEGDD